MAEASTAPEASGPASSLRDGAGRLSLRVRLVAILTALLVLALAVTGAATLSLLRGYLVEQKDDQLLRAATPLGNRALGALLDQQRPGPDEFELPSDYVVQILDARGDGIGPPLRSNASDSAPALPRMAPGIVSQLYGEPFTVSSTTDDDRWRVVALPVVDADGSVAVALPLDDVDATVRRVAALLVLVGLLVVGACVGLGTLAVRRAFRPLTGIEHVAAQIASGDLSRRVETRSGRTEVGRLGAALNGMLTQVEQAFAAREASEAKVRRFVADASHELRTPLAAIRGFAELYRQGAVREPVDVAAAMTRIEDEATRMGALVEDLLMLARLDEPRPVAREPVDLWVLAADAVQDARALAPDRPVQLVVLADDQGPGSATVLGDDARLRQLVTNLVVNALHHTPRGTPVEVAVGTVAPAGPNGLPTAILEVRDHGPGLEPEHAARVFERFYRADSSRSRGRPGAAGRTSGGGSGLGLAIVSAVVASHGGTVQAVATPGGGATFQVTLPAQRP